MQDLNLQLTQRESLLVLGPSGVGKSTFLLTLMGLHESYQGDIEALPADCVMFLPQVQSQLLCHACDERSGGIVCSKLLWRLGRH